MTGALVLALPGLLCAVMAWNLAQPATPVPPTTGAPVVHALPRLGQRAAAGLLAVCATTCLVSAVLLTLWEPPPMLGAAGAAAPWPWSPPAGPARPQ